MNLLEEFDKKIKEGMKVKAVCALPEDAKEITSFINTYKSVKNKAILITKEEKTEVTNEIMLKAIRKEIKELKQTLSTVPENSPLYKEALLQINTLSIYLPKEPSNEEVTRWVKAIIMTLPNGTPFGLKMKECVKQLKGKVEPAKISEILKQLE
jgi:uncharacterized protein YqeY